MSNRIRGESGIPLGLPPYGYMKNPANPNQWIIEEEAAWVVKRIFIMTLDGMGTEQIAAVLSKEHILKPSAYWIEKGLERPRKMSPDSPPYRWTSSTITQVLAQQEYCGDVINFKTYSKSYKNKKRYVNDEENRSIFQGVHEAIIDRATFEKVQAKRGNMRKRLTNDGDRNMFAGILVCADCGHNLHFHFNQGNHDIKYFNCSNYKGNRGTCQTTHYIRVDFLERVVLGEIRRLTKFASQHEDTFMEALESYSRKVSSQNSKQLEKELRSLQKREGEIDVLFQKIYEDNSVGKLSDARFMRLSKQYETEQAELSEQIQNMKQKLSKDKSRFENTDYFMSMVRKYTRAKKLTPRMLNELIEKIEVYHSEKTNGVQTQRITIHYNCVGSIHIPEDVPIEFPDVSLSTRRGVAVTYVPNSLPC